jgi:hypothetical protein
VSEVVPLIRYWSLAMDSGVVGTFVNGNHHRPVCGWRALCVGVCCLFSL